MEKEEEEKKKKTEVGGAFGRDCRQFAQGVSAERGAGCVFAIPPAPVRGCLPLVKQ